MDRKQRINSHHSLVVIQLNEAARQLNEVMQSAGIGASDKEPFLRWAVNTMWSNYKEERMNQQKVVENEIRNLGIRFPNGTVNKEYRAEFHLPVEKLSNVMIKRLEGTGLQFNQEGDGEFVLSGKPEKAGDFELTLEYKVIDGESLSKLTIPIAFNPDPRSLWKNIPTSLDIPYFKPDSSCEYVKIAAGADGSPRKDIVAASQRGRSHAQEGRARDDDFSLFHCDKSDWYIMAVADGAGSAKFSRKGSEVACREVIEHCKKKLIDNPAFESAIVEYQNDRENAEKRTKLTRHVIDIVYKGAMKAHDAVKKVAENSEAKVKDFATTLMFVICKKFEFGWYIASFWVGDGALCIFDAENGTAKLLGIPDEGEFSGQTRFLTMPEIFHDPEVVAKRLRMAIVPDFTALFLMTDGVSDPMFETDKNLNDYQKWEEFYSKLQLGFPEDGIAGVDLSDDNEASKEQLLGWLDFWSPGNHDDRTIAILY